MDDGRRPDFIIGGAPRSGTTWLYHLLDKHPSVFLAKPPRPEPKFFLIDELYSKGIEFYLRQWFSQAPDGSLAGEKSTNYLEGPDVARRIREHLPRVKLVFILRDPVTRAYSNYLWSKMNGLEQEEFPRALELEEERALSLSAQHRYSRPHAYFSRGLYADLLKPFFDLFPRDQLLCLKYEDIEHAPEELAALLHRFLAVAPRPEDALGLGIINPSEKADAELPPSARALLVRRYAEPNRRLHELIGPSFDLWKDN